MRGATRLRAIGWTMAVWLVAGACRPRPAQEVDPPAPGPALTTAHELTVGDLAPDFSLPGSDGKTYSLASYRGRQAVVLAWFAKAFTSG